MIQYINLISAHFTGISPYKINISSTIKFHFFLLFAGTFPNKINIYNQFDFIISTLYKIKLKVKFSTITVVENSENYTNMKHFQEYWAFILKEKILFTMFP